MEPVYSKQEILGKNFCFSYRFNNRLLNILVHNTKNDSNISVSSYRLQSVLVLLANWATANIQRTILDVVGGAESDLQEANRLCSKDLLDITSLDRSSLAQNIPIIEIQTLMWVQQHLKVNNQALEKLSEYYNVIIKNVDFANSTTKTIIDSAVEKATHGLIKELEIVHNPNTQILLTDIIYFKARWTESFDEDRTEDHFFYGTKGKKRVPMMERVGNMRYGETKRCQIVSLQYQCESNESLFFSMHIYLPRRDVSFSEVLNDVHSNDYILPIKEENVALTLPRFTIESNIKLKDILQELGLGSIFKSDNVIPELIQGIKIEDIIQQVKVKVSENETEATAVTYIPMCLGLPPTEDAEPIKMNVNRPFMFEIVEEYSGIVLFSGVINNIEE